MRGLGRVVSWIAQPAVIGVAVWLALGGTGRDVHVPLTLEPEGVFLIAQAKATMNRGLWWSNPDLGLPYADDPLLAPAQAHVDQVLQWLVGLAIPDPIRAVSAAWLLMLMLAGLTGALCLRLLGVSPLGAWCAGALFALSPFALVRYTSAPGLVPYLVPFAATTALLLARGDVTTLSARRSAALWVGLILLGLNAPYFAVFGVVVILTGALAGVVLTRRHASAAAGAAAVGLLTAVLVASHAGWRTPETSNPESTSQEVQVADSELYGLKLRHLLSPIQDHWYDPLRQWATEDVRADFPGESERQASHLGLVGAAGLSALLLALLVPSFAGSGSSGGLLRAASQLALALLLMATVGGFGSVFSELVSPDVRVFARMAPYVAWLAIAAVGLLVDRLPAAPWTRTAWLMVLAVGLADQTVALRPVRAATAGVTTEYRELHDLVDPLEQALGRGARVFQLPIRPYPSDLALVRMHPRMHPYDEFKPQLVSRRLQWSFASAQDAIDAAAAGRPAQELPAYLRQHGYAAVVVDRFGYGDGGLSIQRALEDAPGGVDLMVNTPRYVAYGLRP